VELQKQIKTVPGLKTSAFFYLMVIIRKIIYKKDRGFLHRYQQIYRRFVAAFHSYRSLMSASENISGTIFSVEVNDWHLLGR
jgi:hypothetical protein